MVSLLEAIKLLNLEENDLVSFCVHSEESFSPALSVYFMRKYLDMKKIKVRHIGLYHYRYAPNVNLEFIVGKSDLQVIKRAEMKAKNYSFV